MSEDWECPACGAMTPDGEGHGCGKAGVFWERADAERLVSAVAVTDVVAAARVAYERATKPTTMAAYWYRGHIDDDVLTALGKALAAYDASPAGGTPRGEGETTNE